MHEVLLMVSPSARHTQTRKRARWLALSGALLTGTLAACVGCLGPRVQAVSQAKLLRTPTHLERTDVIDADHPSIAGVVQRLTTPVMTNRQKAVRLHDFVRDEIRFGFQNAFYEVRASEVLAAKVGYCNTKSTLFIALLRCAGIPARQQFVDIDASILKGLFDPGTPYVDHSYVEVLLEDRWVATDSFIVDPPLFQAAAKRLATTNAPIGYGIHQRGSTTWDGTHDSFSQFVNDGSTATLSTRAHGTFADVATFYQQSKESWNKLSRTTRLLLPLFVPKINKAIERVRSEPA